MRTRVVAVVAAVAGLAVGVVVFAQARDNTTTSGPLQQPGAHGQIVQFAAGTTFTDGFEVLDLRGDAPARLVSVTSVGAEQALQQVGVRVAGPDRNLAASSLMRGFPPTERGLGTVRTLQQTLLRPRHQTRDRMGYELLVGYRVVDDTQVAAREKLVVRYRAAGQEHELVLPARLVYCPPEMPSRTCERTAFRMFPDG